MFRYPQDDDAENKGFYQNNYIQQTVTELPKKEELSAHIDKHFVKVGRDLTDHLKVIQALAPKGRVLDYGCSWGYCVHQFHGNGYDAAGF
jgi:hypothetical protein